MASPLSRFLPFLVLALVLISVPASAQGQSGRITGVVRDAQGAPLPDVTVTATNRATGARASATTSSEGEYTITGLAAGTYTVTVSPFGFHEVTRENVQVPANAAATLDLALEPWLLEGVVVTAMLREQELVDVPFSIAAPTSSVLRSRGAEDLEAVAANVAGFSVQNLGPGQSQPAIRGTSSGQIARDQPGVKEEVGAYLDNSVISLSLFTPDLDLFDVSRVEVLRGPQGTLYGSGSLAGTVRYITNQPVLGETSVFGELAGSLIDGGSPGGNVKLGVNAPLGERVAARVAGYYTRFGGFMDAQQPVIVNDTISAYSLDEDVNSGMRAGVRAALRFEPSESFSLTPRVVFQRVDMDGWNRVDDFNILGNRFTTTNPAIDPGERELVTQFEEPFTDDFLLADLNLGYDFGPVDLTSVTSYTFRDILVVRDAGALTSSITGGSLGLPEPIYLLHAPLHDSTESKVWTQELRLSGGLDFALLGLPTTEDRVQWVLGGFYSNNHREYGQSLLVQGFDEAAAPILGAPAGFTEGLRAQRDELFYSDLSYDLEQFAVFGEATVPVGSRLSLTAGLRYYDFNESREQFFDGIFVNDDTGNSLVSQPGDTEANGFAPRFIASYEVSEALTVNVQAAKGFRLGGINDPLNEPLCTDEDLATFTGFDTWEDETAWNYEAGLKSRLLGGRAALNASAFYMDISDLQVVVTAGSCSSRLVLNAPEARSQGIELEFNATPSDHFDFAVSGSWNDSELQSRPVTVDGDPIVIPGVEPGNRLPSVPQFQAAAAATVRWRLAEMPAFVTASFRHVGSRITAIDDHALAAIDDDAEASVDMTGFAAAGGATIGGPLTQGTFTFRPLLDAYNLFNTRLGVIRGDWEIALFVNNVTDERAFLALDRERGTRARVGYLTNPPRTFGISARFEY